MRPDAFAGAAGPRVQQHDGAVAVLANAVDGVRGDRGARSPRLPVLELDVPMHVAIAEAREFGSDARVVVPGAERAAEPRPRIDARWPRTIAARPSARSAASPVVGQQRHPRVVVGVVARRGARRRRSAARSSGYASAHRPCTKNVARTCLVRERVQDAFGVAGRTPRSVGMLRVERQATRCAAIVTHASSPSRRGRTSPAHARRRPRGVHARSCDGHDRDRGREGAVQARRSRPSRRRSAPRPSAPIDEDGGAESDELGGEPEVELGASRARSR